MFNPKKQKDDYGPAKLLDGTLVSGGVPSWLRGAAPMTFDMGAGKAPEKHETKKGEEEEEKRPRFGGFAKVFSGVYNFANNSMFGASKYR